MSELEGEARPELQMAESATLVSPWRNAVRRFRSNKLGTGALVILVGFSAASFFGNALLGRDPIATDIGAVRQSPSAEHWLGTDDVGRDVLARLFAGGQVSLTIGFVAAISATVLGLALGLVAGFGGGLIDATIMRVVDAFMIFPPLVVILALTAMLGPSITTITFVIALLQWPTACRIVRNTTLAVKAQEYVRAARALGVGPVRILLRHIVPATLAPLTVVVTVLAAYAILAESALSFLGLGVNPPEASWGGMLTAAQSLTIIDRYPWLWVPPGACIALTVLSISFVGDAIRDALDTRLMR